MEELKPEWVMSESAKEKPKAPPAPAQPKQKGTAERPGAGMEHAQKPVQAEKKA